MSARVGFLFGVAAAALAAIPATLRTPELAAGHPPNDGGPSVLVWVALAGATAAILGPLLAALSHLRPVRQGLMAIVLGIGLASLPTAVLLSVLKSSTHHRPLGAVTFAFAAAFVLLAASAASLRLLTWFQLPTASGIERFARFALGICALAGPLLLLLRVGASPHLRTSLFDASFALGLAALSLLVPWPARVLGWGKRAGFLLWVLAVGIGLLAARAAHDRAVEASSVLLAPYSWLLR